MNFFVVLTTECNLKCKYCYGECCDFFSKDIEFKDVPENIAYKIADLKKFMEKDKNPTIILYGGEPLLRLDLLKKILDNIKARFMLQTNGINLENLGTYVNKLYNLMFSIDGDEKTTDYYRGNGTYKKIIESAKWARKMKFEKEVLARMTVMEKTDIYEQVKFLLFNDDFKFDSVHWQLNAMFWNNFEKRKEKLKEWIEKSYNPGIKKLVDFWIGYMKEHGKVLKIYPFLGLTLSFLNNEKSLLRCGAGWAQYAVLTNGDISACPVISGLKGMTVGNIFSSNPNELKKVFVKNPCLKCNIYEECGGRCLYANALNLWGSEGYNLVCTTVRFLIDSIKEKIPEIKGLVKNSKISMKDFEYDKFNSCEIIP